MICSCYNSFKSTFRRQPSPKKNGQGGMSWKFIKNEEMQKIEKFNFKT